MFVRHVNDPPRDQRSRAVEMHPTKEFSVVASSGTEYEFKRRPDAQERSAEFNLHVCFHCIQRIHKRGDEGTQHGTTGKVTDKFWSAHLLKEYISQQRFSF